ncbi:hypothetical protein AB0J52_03280 [Spirillospora sp. NPDC049652]
MHRSDAERLPAVEPAAVLARELAAELARLRAASPEENPLLEMARGGHVTVAHLRNVVLIEDMYHGAELAAYGCLLARFPQGPVSGFLIEVARVVQEARSRLADVARSIGARTGTGPGAGAGAGAVAPTAMRRDITAHGFCSYVSWLGLNASRAAAGLALYSDPEGVYYGGSAALVDALRRNGPEPTDEFAEYYTGVPSQRQNDQALQVVRTGLEEGDDPAAALDAGRLCDQYMALLWKAAAHSYEGEA